LGFCTSAYIRYVTFNSSTATGNATGFNLESEVFAKGADTQANNCISWSNIDRGFYLGRSESLPLVASKSAKQAVEIRIKGTNNTVTGCYVPGASQ
jgi:hypothetical protein